MPDSLLTTGAERLARQRGLVLVVLILMIGVFTFLEGLTRAMVRAPDPLVFSLQVLFVGVVWTVFLLVPVVLLLAMGLLSLRAAWVAQKAVRDAVRHELNVRALKADPQSPHGLPGFPDVSAGGGDLAQAGGGGLAEAGSGGRDD